MDSAYQYTQPMGQSPFFYYNPDPKPDTRQHGHFSQQPTNVQIPMYHQHMHTVPSTPVYSRPTSSCSQPPMQPKLFASAFPGNMTPMASPRPIYHRPTILIQDQPTRIKFESEYHETDLYYNPATPPLSASSSSMSSPSSCDLLPTPITTIFGIEGFEGVKTGCEGEVQSENLAGGDWARCGSPPMTPVFVHPTSLTGAAASELLSATSCPSLSPSPAPFLPEHQQNSPSSQPEFDFCDPRNLTVASATITTASASASAPQPVTVTSGQFPTLPTLCPAVNEEQNYTLSSAALTTRDNRFDFAVAHDGLPTFDQISDLDSESDEFVNGLVNFPATENVHYLGSKRQRTSSDLIHFDEYSEDEFDESPEFEETEPLALALPPSPPASVPSVKSKKEKRTKKSKTRAAAAHCDEDSSAFDSMVRSRRYTVPMNAASGATPQETSNDGEQHSAAPSQSGDSDQQTSNMMGGSDAGTPSQSAPINRRGRKQSLTEDPSKTFICDICNRRFRRQEHLKRHYRSLHTEDKPFECQECGKKFSRSDNLAQHARTHGSGAIVMGVLEDGELPADHIEMTDDPEHIRAYSKVLFSVAAAVSGSDSDPSTDGTHSSTGSQARRKRKRSQ